MIAVLIGGVIGADYGSKRFGNVTLKRVLACAGSGRAGVDVGWSQVKGKQVDR